MCLEKIMPVFISSDMLTPEEQRKYLHTVSAPISLDMLFSKEEKEAQEEWLLNNLNLSNTLKNLRQTRRFFFLCKQLLRPRSKMKIKGVQHFPYWAGIKVPLPFTFPTNINFDLPVTNS